MKYKTKMMLNNKELMSIGVIQAEVECEIPSEVVAKTWQISQGKLYWEWWSRDQTIFLTYSSGYSQAFEFMKEHIKNLVTKKILEKGIPQEKYELTLTPDEIDWAVIQQKIVEVEKEKEREEQEEKERERLLTELNHLISQKKHLIETTYRSCRGKERITLLNSQSIEWDRESIQSIQNAISILQNINENEILRQKIDDYAKKCEILEKRIEELERLLEEKEEDNDDE